MAKANQETFLLSIVICTYNRANLLRIAIESVLQQEFPVDQYELLIVDNNSKDNTRELVLEIAQSHPQIRYIFEENQGLSIARNRGWKEAKGKYVIYLDDDGKAQLGWLTAAQKAASTHEPLLFGGPNFALYLKPKPLWFKDEYGSFTLGKSARPLADGEFLTGCNFAVRRSLFESIGGFRPDFGMDGNKIAYGEETELQLRIREQNPAALVLYEPDMAIWHLVRLDKLSLLSHFKKSFLSGVYGHRVFTRLESGLNKESSSKKYGSILNSYGREIGLFFIILLRLIKLFTWGWILRDRQKYPYLQNYFYERLGAICLYLGIRIETIHQISK
jgi:glycosyltransferase involved in cell wall biosynthesis